MRHTHREWATNDHYQTITRRNVINLSTLKLSILKFSLPALLLCFAGSALANPVGSMSSSSEAGVPATMGSRTMHSSASTALGQKVQTKLDSDTRLQNAMIQAQVTRTGTVLLKGIVGSKQQSQIAEQVASNVSGVSQVRNELRVPKGE